MIHAKPGQVWSCTLVDQHSEDHGEITRIILVLKEEHTLTDGALYLYTRYQPQFDGLIRRSHMNESPNALWERIV